MSSLKPIARSVKKVTSNVCKKKFISLGRVLDHWSDIIGPEMAYYAEPASIKVRKKGYGKNQTFEKTLQIAVAPAHSMTVSYRKGMILERINRLLPYEGIIDLEFIPTTRRLEKTLKTKEKVQKTLSEKEKDFLSSILDDMEDGEIKDRLLSMGRSIINEQNSK